MKKLILIAALLATATSYAATNKFTFRVNSSGANMYVCGFHLGNEAAFNAGNNAVSSAYAVWSEQVIDEWTGEAYNNSPVVTRNSLTETNINEAIDFTIDYSAEKVGKSGIFTEIKDLTIYLSDEKFGAEYYVDVCYNVPLFMDLDNVDFKINNNVQYSNLNDRNYYERAGIQGGVRTFPIDLTTGENYVESNFSERPLDLANNTATVGDIFSGLQFVGQKDHEFVIVNRYHFFETKTDNRPHVAHGGTYILGTDVIPVSSK